MYIFLKCARESNNVAYITWARRSLICRDSEGYRPVITMATVTSPNFDMLCSVEDVSTVEAQRILDVGRGPTVR